MSRFPRALIALAVAAVGSACAPGTGSAPATVSSTAPSSEFATVGETTPGAAAPEQPAPGSTTGATHPADSASPASSTSPADGAHSTVPITTAPTTTAPATTLPGGIVGRNKLADQLDAAGRLILDRISAAGGAPQLCSYLFGTPVQVADVALLPGEVTLDRISSTKVTDDAALVACVYSSDAAPMLALQVGVGPPIDADLPGEPIIVTSGRVQAVLSYAPGRTGTRIAAATARLWLTEVTGRVTADPAPRGGPAGSASTQPAPGSGAAGGTTTYDGAADGTATGGGAATGGGLTGG